jgi:DNA-binding IclR family transcriptional regulator
LLTHGPLYVIEGVSRVCLEQAQSVHHLARHSSVGEYFPLHAGASGKVLLAYLPDEERKRILSQIPLERFTPRTVTDPEELERDLERIRKRGYAVSKGEREAGAYSIVAPVWNASGRVVASLTISGPIFRLSDKRLKANIRGVLAAAREVSERLGYRGEK